jgi:hypothetical protein
MRRLLDPAAAPRQSRFLRLDKRSSHDNWVRCTFECKCGCAQSHWSEHAQPHRKCFEPCGARHGASWYAISITWAAVRPLSVCRHIQKADSSGAPAALPPTGRRSRASQKGPATLARSRPASSSICGGAVHRTSQPTGEHDEQRPIDTGVVTRRSGRGRGGGRCRRSPPGEACAPLRYIAPL